MTALALIGPGKIARAAHLPAIAATPGVTLVACVSDGAGLPGLPCFASVAALRAGGPPVDAVAICTPPQARAAIAHDAIAAGLHVLLEKPPAATLAACAAIRAAGQAAGVTVYAAWHSRHAGQVAAARAWLAGRRILGGEVTWAEDVRVWHPGQAWLWQPGGLGVFDSAINALSILTEICPVPLAVATSAFAVPANAHTPIRAELALDAAGATIALQLDFLHPGPPLWSIALHTDAGTLALTQGGASLALPGAAPLHTEAAEYHAVYARYAALIAAGASDCDDAPLRLVADAFLLARITQTAPFHP